MNFRTVNQHKPEVRRMADTFGFALFRFHNPIGWTANLMVEALDNVVRNLSRPIRVAGPLTWAGYTRTHQNCVWPAFDFPRLVVGAVNQN